MRAELELHDLEQAIFALRGAVAQSDKKDRTRLGKALKIVLAVRKATLKAFQARLVESDAG